MATESLLETMVTGDSLGNFSMGLQITSTFTSGGTASKSGPGGGGSGGGGSSGGGPSSGGPSGGGSSGGD